MHIEVKRGLKPNRCTQNSQGAHILSRKPSTASDQNPLNSLSAKPSSASPRSLPASHLEPKWHTANFQSSTRDP